MSNYNNLKTTIDASIKQNSNQDITGSVLNSVLNQMVTTLGAGYQYMGVATTTTNPGSPDAKVFYIANGKGAYTNFGGIEVTEDDVVVLCYDTTWHKVATGIASQAKLSELEQKTDTLIPQVDENTQAIKAIAVSGGASVASAVIFDNGENAQSRLGDRTADETQMGYIVLRKGVPFAEQVTQANTIYEIRYDFEVGGTKDEPISVPAGSVLKFNGGVLSNGYLQGNSTSIDAATCKIFGIDLVIIGKWDVDGAYVEWFGATGAFGHDDRPGIQKCIDSFFHTKLLQKNYNILSTIEYDGKNRGIVVPGFKRLSGVNEDLSDSWLKAGVEMESLVYLAGGHSVIENLLLSGGGVYPNHGEDGLVNYGVDTKEEIAHLTFNNIRVMYCKKDGFKIHAFIIRMNSCNSSNNQGDGFHIEYTNGRGTTLVMHTCYAHECSGTGFNIVNMSYSTLLSCACDKCGYSWDTSASFDYSTSKYAYRIDNCNTISIISCGQEGCYNAFEVVNTSTSISFIDDRVALATNAGYDASKAIFFEWAFGVTMMGCFISFNVNRNTPFLSIGDNAGLPFATNTTIINCYIVDDSGYRSPMTLAHCVQKFGVRFVSNDDFTFDGKKLLARNGLSSKWYGYEYNETDANEHTFYEVKNLSNFVYPKPVTFIVKGGTSEVLSVGTLENVVGKICIKGGTSTESNVFFGINTFKIHNCQEIIFEHLEIRPSLQEERAIPHLLEIRNSRVVFRNCYISITAMLDTLTSVIDADGCEIVFENCTFNNPSRIPIVNESNNNVVLMISGKDMQSSKDGIWRNMIGTSAQRPTLIFADYGFSYYDTTLAKPIWWNGGKWVDATGADV